MTTKAFICDIEDSVESLRISEDSHKLKDQVSSNTLLKVLVAVLMLLVVGFIGGIIWINVSHQELTVISPELHQDCPHRYNMTASFIGTNTNFTAPRNGTYLIYGKIFKKGGKANGFCEESLRLVQKTLNSEDKKICEETFCHDKVQFSVEAELEKGARLSIWLNCNDMEIIDTKSVLKVYEL